MIGNYHVRCGVGENQIFWRDYLLLLSSMYPSIILAYGIDNETLLGKFLVFLDESEEETDPLFDSFGEKMMEDDPEIIATTYFNLKPTSYYLENLDEYLM